MCHDPAAQAGGTQGSEHLRSAENQVEFLREMGDAVSVIDAMLDALDPGWRRTASSS